MSWLRREEALPCFERACEIGIGPEIEKAWYNRGAILIHFDRFEEALQCYDQAISIAPQYVNALSNRAGLLAGLGRAEESLAAAEHVLIVDPLNGFGWFYKIQALDLLGRQTDGLRVRREFAVCADMVFRVETDSRAAVQLAQAVMTCDQEAAVKGFDRALTLTPGLPEALFCKAMCRRTLGRLAESLQCYQAVVEAEPHNDSAWLNQGNGLISRVIRRRWLVMSGRCTKTLGTR